MGFEQPKKIARARIEGDTEYLRAAAYESHKVQKRNRERKEIHEILDQIAKEEKELEDELQRREANEHIISPDGEDQDYFEEK